MPQPKKKDIMPAGTYLVSGPNKQRIEQTFTRERLKHFVEEFDRMKANGNRVPAPYWHDPEAIPVHVDDTENPLRKSRDNGGWWDRLWAEDGRLFGEVVPATDEDEQIIGTKVREVSPWIKSEWTDGKGNVYKDAITHLAMVTHPVVPGQENFLPADKLDKLEQSIAAGICLSITDFIGLAPDDIERVKNTKMSLDETSLIKKALEALRKVNFNLPPDTTEDNILERIVVAGEALAGADGENSGTVDKAPTDAKTKPAPVAMSLGDHMTTHLNADGTLKPHYNADGTLKPGFNADGTPLNTKLSLTPAEAYATEAAKKDLLRRAEAAVASGRTTKAYVDANIIPLINEYQLSIDTATNQLKPQNVDLLMSNIEALPLAQALNGQPVVGGMLGSFVQGTGSPDKGDPQIITEEDADKIVEQMLSTQT